MPRAKFSAKLGLKLAKGTAGRGKAPFWPTGKRAAIALLTARRRTREQCLAMAQHGYAPPKEQKRDAPSCGLRTSGLGSTGAPPTAPTTGSAAPPWSVVAAAASPSGCWVWVGSPT